MQEKIYSSGVRPRLSKRSPGAHQAPSPWIGSAMERGTGPGVDAMLGHTRLPESIKPHLMNDNGFGRDGQLYCNGHFCSVILEVEPSLSGQFVLSSTG